MLMELLAFYNVENLFLPDPKPTHKLDPTNSGLRNWDDRKYKNKLHKISHVFQLIEDKKGTLPFLIGLSEISGRKVLEELVQIKPFNSNYGIVHYNSMDERKVDVALLYDKSKVEILDSEAITFFFERGNHIKDDYDTTRDVLFSKIKCNDEIINVFVAHLPSKREKDVNKPKRDFILKEIKSKIAEIIDNTNESVVLFGDFNENPDEENLVEMLSAPHGKILENPFRQLFTEKKYSTYHYKSGLLFDQIILSISFFNKSIGFCFEEASVFNAEEISSRDKMFSGRPFRTYAGTRYLGGYSDHFPVIVELRKHNK